MSSNALSLRFHTLRPGPDLALRRPEQEEAQAELLEVSSVLERRLRTRLGEMVAAQAVEDEAGRAGLRVGMAGPRLYHRYNAVLKQVTGGKSRAAMTLAELEAAVGTAGRARRAQSHSILHRPTRIGALIHRQRLDSLVELAPR